MKMKPSILLPALCLLAAAAAAEQPATLHRICDDGGCAMRAASPPEVRGEVAASTAPGNAAPAPLQVSPKAAHELAWRYLRGDSVPRDSYQALKWLRHAAGQGHSGAQLDLGRIYLTGLEEMGADPGEAAGWLEMAARQGEREAVALLAQARQARQQEMAAWRAREDEREERYGNGWYGGWWPGFHADGGWWRPELYGQHVPRSRHSFD